MDNSIQKILKEVTDMQLIDVVSKAEKWTHEQVYKTAHTQVGVEGIPWEDFNKSLQPYSGGELPVPVRLELMRAFEIHMDNNSLPGSPSTKDNPLAAFSANKFFKWAMWFWVFYFIITIFF